MKTHTFESKTSILAVCAHRGKMDLDRWRREMAREGLDQNS